MISFNNLTNEHLEKNIFEFKKIIRQLKNELKFCYSENAKRIQNSSIEKMKEMLKSYEEELQKRK